MKLSKLVFLFSFLALAASAQAQNDTTEVVVLPAVVVEATRLPDPLATMRATLDARVHVAAPKPLKVKLSSLNQFARSHLAAPSTSPFPFKQPANSTRVL